MSVPRASGRALRLARILSFSLGVGLLCLAFAADRVGLGRPGSVGVGQLLVGFLGLAAIAVGVLGRRIVSVHVAIAVTLLNSLLLVAGLELVAIAIARAGLLPDYRQRVIAGHQEVPYYAEQQWTADYWSEALGAERYLYEPYSVWRHAPFEGQTINISIDGLRRTPGAECREDSHRIFAFGGSTLWGWGAPDWGTIPAYLQEILAKRRDGPVCVVNMAEDAYVSTQGVVTLLRELQRGNVPDAVVFYDGVNDVFAAHQTGQAGAHSDLERIAGRIEARKHPLRVWIESSRLHWLWMRISGRANGASAPADTSGEPAAAGLAEAVVGVYLANLRIVEALALEWDFDLFFFWQPHLSVGDKPLTDGERTMRSRLDPRLAALSNAVYGRIQREAAHRDRLWYLASVFDGAAEQVWIDEWGHVTPAANRLIAQHIAAAILP